MAFSKAEKAILAGTILVVLSLVISSTWAYHLYRRQAMVRQDIALILESSARFYGEYGMWPTMLSGEYGDVRYGRKRANAEMMHVLVARDGIGNTGHIVNPHQIVFLEIPPASSGFSGQVEDGSFIDPWGTPYQVVLDTDLDEVCNIEHSIYERVIDQGIVVWSCGPDQLSDTADDILSWKREKVQQ
jgi:hypothetical protein